MRDVHPHLFTHAGASCIRCGRHWDYRYTTPCDAAQKPEPYRGEPLRSADPNCKHEIVDQWSGYKCKHCQGWFCL